MKELGLWKNYLPGVTQSQNQDLNLFFSAYNFNDLSTFAFYVGINVCQYEELSRPIV